jgi:alpha-1,3-rhamnosyl/mannosyltransferase
VKVAVDARWVQRLPLGGVGRGLAHVLPLVAEQVELTLLTTTDAPATGLGLPEVALRTPPPGVAAGWLQWSCVRWLASFAGVFHCPWYGLPYRQPVPMVASLHDLTFEHRPEWFSRGRRATFRAQARHAARTARVLLVPSAHVRDDVLRTYRVPAERILVAPQAVDPVFGPEADEHLLAALRAGWEVPDRYAVALAGAPRRRVDLAVAAWRLARHRAGDLALVVVGEPPADAPRERGLVWAGRLDDGDWAATLAGASALLYPTEDEGFGMPALEAAASGTPVVCARVGSLPEVLGDAAGWVDELSPGALGDALLSVLRDPGVAAELSAAGLARARCAPGWADSAAVHLQAYATAYHGSAV